MYQEFDWEFAQNKTKNPRKLQWLLENCNNTEITEERFVNEMKLLRLFSSAMKKWKHYSPAKLRKQYQNLKTKFGFFTGGLK